MVKTRSNLKKTNPNVTKKQSSKEKSTLGLKNSKVPSNTSSETVNESSPLSHLYTVLNYFSNYFQFLRRNLENTIILGNSIVTESTSSDSKENQIPQERNEKISSEYSRFYTRWAWLIGLVIVTYTTSYFIYSSYISTQLDLDSKEDNNFNLLTVSSDKIQSIQDQNRDFDITNYLMHSFNYFKNFLFNTKQFIIDNVGFGNIVSFITCHILIWWKLNGSTAHNDNDPRHEPPIDNNFPASFNSLGQNIPNFALTTGELSDSSEGQATPLFSNVGQATNSNENLLTLNNY